MNNNNLYNNNLLVAHVLFDDATELNDDEEFVPNQFVRQFIEVIDEAGRYVYIIVG